MHIAMTKLAKAMAVLGALVLSFLIVMTCVSVLGREVNGLLHSDLLQSVAPGLSNWLLELGVGPVLGDFELLENGMPFAIFAFMPLAQIQASHVTVDVFTTRVPPRIIGWMTAVIEVIFAIVLVTFAFKLLQGTQAKMRFGETTYLLQFEVWQAFALAFGASVVAAVTGVWMAGVRLYEAATGNSIVDPDHAEAGH